LHTHLFSFVMYVEVNEQAYVSSICFCFALSSSFYVKNSQAKQEEFTLCDMIRFFLFCCCPSFVRLHNNMYAKSKHTISFFLFESRADKSICRLFSSSFSGAFFALSLMKQKMCDETAVNVLTPGTIFQCSVLFFFFSLY
jgi:hypothetical protein